jgi:predicted GNAT superfamily acetyltransferase
MQRKRLQELAFISSYFKVAAIDRRVVAFLLAMREDAPYTNDNFAWFAARYTRFVYVDRIVVDPACAGMNIGTRLYDDLFDYARKREVETITCEYNVEPPNRASQRFHDRFGFNEVGTRWVTPGKKRVSLQTVDVRQHAATRK